MSIFDCVSIYQLFCPKILCLDRSGVCCVSSVFGHPPLPPPSLTRKRMTPSTLISNMYPVQTAVLNCLNAADLVRIGKTSKELWEAFHHFARRAYNIDLYLLPFIPDPDSFRKMQCDTGAIISGSFALQFLTREVWPNTGLDVFVHREHRERAGRWLLDNGFSYRPATKIFGHTVVTQQQYYEDAIECPGFRKMVFTGVADVLDFVRTTGNVQKTVVLHITWISPIQTVLKFPFSQCFI